MQLTIDLPDTTYQALKNEAYHSSESINKVVLRYLSMMNTATSLSIADNWTADFFEKTAGCFETMPLERAPQGDYEQRLDLV